MPKDGWIYIEGEGYSPDDLTFREQREMRKVFREFVENPEADLSEADMMDLLPVLAYMIRRRDNPGYTLDQALDTPAVDLVTPPDPPTRPAAKRAKQ